MIISTTDYLLALEKYISQELFLYISRLIIFTSGFLKKLFVSMTVHSIFGNLIVLTT